MAVKSTKTLEIFFCYAYQDENLLEQLDKHVNALRRLGQIHTWDSRHVHGGENSRLIMEHHLSSANVILLLISADFLASEHCYEQAQRAFRRHQAGEALVIAVLLR